MSLARSFRRLLNRKNRKSSPRQNKVFLEPLEPRLLLDAQPLSYAAAPGTAINATLRLQVDTLQLQLINNNSNQSVLVSQALADTTSVEITGADKSDWLVVDFSKPFNIPILFTDSSTDHQDTLEVTGAGQTWNITGANEGSVGSIEFSGIENLKGSEGYDTFVVQNKATLDGTIDGGGGDDTLDSSAVEDNLGFTIRKDGTVFRQRRPGLIGR